MVLGFCTRTRLAADGQTFNVELSISVKYLPFKLARSRNDISRFNLS